MDGKTTKMPKVAKVNIPILGYFGKLEKCTIITLISYVNNISG